MDVATQCVAVAIISTMDAGADNTMAIGEEDVVVEEDAVVHSIHTAMAMVTMHCRIKTLKNLRICRANSSDRRGDVTSAIFVIIRMKRRRQSNVCRSMQMDSEWKIRMRQFVNFTMRKSKAVVC